MNAEDRAQQAKLAAAVRAHRAGRLREAIAGYEALLQGMPDDADILYRLGLALAQLGSCADAVVFFNRSLNLKPDRPTVQLNLAAGAHADLGVALEAVGREREALECFERAVALDPSLAVAHHNHALLLARRGEHERALQSFDKVLAIQPNNPVALHARAFARYLLRKYVEALHDYDSLAAQGDASASALVGRGATLVALRRFGEALAPLDRAIKLLPENADAHIQRGVALLNCDRHAEAVESFDKALAIRPNDSDVLNNRGIALTLTWQLSQALDSFLRSAALAGSTADNLTNTGIVLKLLGRYREAAAAFGRALTRNPGDPSARFALAFLHLTLGEFAAGWPLYEARFDVAALSNPARHFSATRWSGSQPLEGKTLLVHAEQGLGDVIQFCRYLSLLVAQGVSVVFEVMPSIKSLLRTLPCAIRLIGRGEPLPPVDYYCPLLSLPLAFNTRPETIPAQVPYLTAESERSAYWLQRLRALPGLRVGIAWQGNPDVEKLIWARGRSIPLAVLEPLAQLPEVCLISLQKGPGAEQLRNVSFAGRIVDLSAEVDQGPDAFLDTAAVMAGLDLVISSDTAVAHLAGALGRPVWVMLAASPEWRWGLERSDSPWYPTMRLFRQTADRDWTVVVAAIVDALRAISTV